MNPFAILFSLAAAVGILGLPRRWAPIPFLIGASYMTVAQGIYLGPIYLPVFRILIIVGIVRTLSRGEFRGLHLNTVDKLVIFWGVWTIFASFFHAFEEGSGPKYASGIALNIVGAYFLFRAWCRSIQDCVTIATTVAIVTIPISAAMLIEQVTMKNLFSVFGGVGEDVLIRDGKLRAQGPFRHPILAGTVGATMFPIVFSLFPRNRVLSSLGCGACVMIVLFSSSSGPLLSWLFSLFGLSAWYFRKYIKYLPKAILAGYLFLELFWGKPPYYIIAMMDMTGSSTARFRADLIHSAINHFDEWWLFGTDYTRHWMFSGVSFSPNHTDITNYYLSFGVMAGILAVLAIAGIVYFNFRIFVTKLESNGAIPRAEKFTVLCFGSSLFAHATTSISVSYFDQSMVFFWLTMGCIASFPDFTGPRSRKRPGSVGAAGNDTHRPSSRRALPNLSPAR